MKARITAVKRTSDGYVVTEYRAPQPSANLYVKVAKGWGVVTAVAAIAALGKRL